VTQGCDSDHTDAPARPNAYEALPKADLGRLRSFSDGVLAIAITLLVLNLDVPNLSGRRIAELPQALLELTPDVLAYALGFAVIGRFWIIHHRMFLVLRAADGKLMALNLVFLGLAAMMPFTSELLGRYGDQSAAAILYAAVIALASIFSWTMMRYALRHNLVKPEERQASGPFGTTRGLAIPAVFLLSIPVALFNPYAAEGMWIASFLVHPSRHLRRSRSFERAKSSAKGDA
jgi:uncharacterized membrane protein